MSKNFIIGWLSLIVVLLSITCAYQHKLIIDKDAYIQWVTPIKQVGGK